MPGASKDYDPWDLLLREFVTNNTLDLRGKGITEVSPKLWKYEGLLSVDLSQNPQLAAIPEDIYLLRNLKSLRISNS